MQGSRPERRLNRFRSRNVPAKIFFDSYSTGLFINSPVMKTSFCDHQVERALQLFSTSCLCSSSSQNVALPVSLCSCLVSSNAPLCSLQSAWPSKFEADVGNIVHENLSCQDPLLLRLFKTTIKEKAPIVSEEARKLRMLFLQIVLSRNPNDSRLLEAQ